MPDAPAVANIFNRLRSPKVVVSTRALLSGEWPRLRAETAAALAAGDGTALRRLSHYLQSSPSDA